MIIVKEESLKIKLRKYNKRNMSPLAYLKVPKK